MSGLRGLILDWGGVLTAPLDVATTAWARRDGVDLGHFRDVMRAWLGVRPDGDGAASGDSDAARDSELLDGGAVARLEQAPDDGSAGDSPLHRLERGELAVHEFERALAAALAERGSPVQPGGLVHRVLGDLAGLDDAMVALVARARGAGLRTALLSNSWGNSYPAELTGGLFDAVVISGEVGMRKPELRIYRHTADLLGLPPDACVMVDDLPHNVRAAVAAGMVAVLHRSYPETLAELEILFDLRLH
jgi:HAD superfamily hydrolase (TIGR01509 family)